MVLFVRFALATQGLALGLAFLANGSINRASAICSRQELISIEVEAALDGGRGREGDRAAIAAGDRVALRGLSASRREITPLLGGGDSARFRGTMIDQLVNSRVEDALGS